jgi:hypothetical protein
MVANSTVGGPTYTWTSAPATVVNYSSGPVMIRLPPFTTTQPMTKMVVSVNAYTWSVPSFATEIYPSKKVRNPPYQDKLEFFASTDAVLKILAYGFFVDVGWAVEPNANVSVQIYGGVDGSPTIFANVAVIKV